MKETNIGATAALILLILAPGVAAGVRLCFIPFSSRVRTEVKRHPFLHLLWLVVAVVVLVAGLKFLAEAPE